MSLELNSCVLIDYGLWAAKSEGRQWVEQCIEQCLEHPPEPRSGLCPELLADFRIPNLLGARRGHRGQFSVQSDNRFSGGGGGVGSPPRAWRRVGVPGAAGAKKICEIGVGFSFAAHSEPFESQGARAAKRYVNGNLVEREKGDEFGIKLLLPHRLSPVGSKK